MTHLFSIGAWHCLGQNAQQRHHVAVMHPVAKLFSLNQPLTLHRTVKPLSAYRLSNNTKWRWWMWMAAAYRRTTDQVDGLGLRAGSHLALSLHSSNEAGELLKRLWPSWRYHTNCQGSMIVIIICGYYNTHRGVTETESRWPINGD